MEINKKRDTIFCVLVLFTALLIGAVSLNYRLASSYFPLMLAGFMAVMALVLLARTLKQRNTELSVEEKSKTNSHLIGFAKVFGLIIIYVMALSYFGYIISTILFLASAMLIFGERRLNWVLAISICMTLLLAYLFFEFLGVAPPESMFSIL